MPMSPLPPSPSARLLPTVNAAAAASNAGKDSVPASDGRPALISLTESKLLGDRGRVGELAGRRCRQRVAEDGLESIRGLPGAS